MARKKPIKILFAEQNEYFHALGRFVDLYARVEGDLSFWLHMLSGLPDNVAKIVFAGQGQSDQMIQLIKKLFEIRKIDGISKKHMNLGLERIKAISELRNTVLHYGTQIQNWRPISTTNASRKPSNRETTTYILSARDFWRLCKDMDKARAHINYAFALPMMRKNLRQWKGSRLQKAWLYKFEHKKQVSKPQLLVHLPKRRNRRSPSQK